MNENKNVVDILACLHNEILSLKKEIEYMDRNNAEMQADLALVLECLQKSPDNQITIVEKKVM